MFPNARIVLYCEFFHGVQGRDVGFDPEFPEAGADAHVALYLKNASTLLALQIVILAYCRPAGSGWRAM